MVVPPPPRLRVPVCVRVSPDAAGGLRLDDVRAAVADAVAAACARFPLPRLGYAPGDVTTVEVGASGPEGVAVSLLAAAQRGATEGAARAGCRDHPARRLSDRLGDTASEPYDPARVRYTPTGMTYEIPFFDGGTTRVPLRDETPRPAPPELPAAGAVVSVARAIEVAWRWHVHRNSGWAADRELPGYNGLVRLPSGLVQRCYVFLHDIQAVGPDGTPVPGRFAYRVVADEGYYSLVVFPDRAGLGHVGDSAAGEWFERGRLIPIVFVTQAPYHVPGRGPGPADDSGAVDDPLESLPTGPGEPAPPGGEGQALDAGGGTGRARARLDVFDPAGAPHNHVRAQWPVPPPVPARLADLLDRRDDLDVCEPFHVEPAVSRLYDVRDLAGRMRALAAGLGIDECGYLGTFAVHAAEWITLHAHGVGVAAAGSPVRTSVTVHPDGTGNNGYVDVQPGAGPDLEWLKTLASLTRELVSFAADLTDTYGYSQNAGLVGVLEDSPDYGGWLLRFYRAFNRAMVLAHETLFTETCRLLLLQQLRSSADGIAGRRDPAAFPGVLENLRMKLDTLGEVVLWPQVLLDTLAHAADVYATGGTVREVLSIQPTSDYDDVTIYLPAPIGRVPRRVLERVADGRLEMRGRERVIVFEDGTYTADGLRDMLNKRRAVLNASDPLFFQIPDLQRLALITEGGPDELQRYLRDLLDEMDSANRKMTAEAGDPEDGGAFALEASQYVKREGGRDARGLRYQLQGIHQLADDLLRPYLAGDPYFAEGINQAIDHKADSDVLLAIASSVGIIVLGLLCAPLGAVAAAAITGAAGIAFAVHDVLDAQRQTDLYHALEDPELFEHWQDVQLAQLMAAISVAFSVFDVVSVGKAAHELTSTALAAMKVSEKQGARTAVKLVAESAREQILKGLSEQMLARAVREAVAQGVVVAVMNTLLPHVIEPVLVPWIRRQAQEHGTLAEVDAELGPLATAGGTP